jgi:hypothetical protein
MTERRSALAMLDCEVKVRKELDPKRHVCQIVYTIAQDAVSAQIMLASLSSVRYINTSTR